MPNCYLCNVELILDTNWKNHRSTRNDYICIECQKNKIKKLRNEAKKKAVEYLGGKCMKCGGEFPVYVYDFHHRDPLEKDKGLARLMSSRWEKIKVELDKCDLLCANCHRIEHHGNDTGEINDE